MNRVRRRCRPAPITALLLSAMIGLGGCGGEEAATGGGLPSIDTRPAALRHVRITVVYDNVRYRTDTSPDWGFACLVEGAGGPILFDTGGSEAVLRKNCGILGLDLAAVETVFVSHDHRDHTGGIEAVPADGGRRACFVPKSMGAFGAWRLEELGQSATRVETPVKVGGAAFSTGEMRSLMSNEQALVVDTDGGLIVVAGCAHPGVVELAERATALGGKKVRLVMGGFHLIDHTPSDVGRIIAGLKELGVAAVAPSHCTGADARRLFKEAFGAGFIDSGTGRVISGKDLAG